MVDVKTRNDVVGRVHALYCISTALCDIKVIFVVVFFFEESNALISQGFVVS